MAAAGYGKAGIWTIGTGIEVTVLELAALVNRLTGRDSQLVFKPARKGELSPSALACRLAAQDLGWQRATSLSDGVQAVIRWFETGAPDRALR